MDKHTTLCLMTAILVAGEWTQKDALEEAYSIFNRIRDDAEVDAFRETEDIRRAALDHRGRP